MSKMNADVKAAWISALVSGEFPPHAADDDGRFYLAHTGEDDVTRFSALGVLAELCARAGRADKYDQARNRAYWGNACPSVTYGGYYRELPGEVATWAGVPQDPALPGGWEFGVWALDHTFTEVAEVIRQVF